MLLGLAFLRKRWSSQVASKTFCGQFDGHSHFGMANYIHLHHEVPAEILPLESKPPIIAVFLMVMAILNMYLFKKSKREIMENGIKTSKSKSENQASSIPPKVLFFDVNESLLALGNLKKSIGKVLGGREDLVPLWFTTMLHYSLVSTAGRQYAEFGTIGAATLRMVAANNGIELTEDEAKEALGPLRSLPPHPEVKEALGNLRKAGYKMASLTNSSNLGVKTQFEKAGLTHFFDERLSIEDVGKYKPDREVYDWAARKLGAQPNECMMIAAHGWDIAGAIWAGWRGAFIARPGRQLYPLAPLPEINEPNLLKISEKLIALRNRLIL